MTKLPRPIAPSDGRRGHAFWALELHHANVERQNLGKGAIYWLEPADLGTHAAGENFAHNFTASGGTDTLVYSVQSGVLPSGFSLTSYGSLTGVVDAGDLGKTFSFIIKVTDGVTSRSRAFFFFC